MKKIKTLAHFSIYFTFLLALIGCDNKAVTRSDLNSATKTITVATSASPKPFTFFSPERELVGFDIDVTKAIFTNLPEYQLEYVITEFGSVLAGLDADRYQIGANNFVMNDARKEKYYFSKPIFENRYVIAVNADRIDINNFDDLRGKQTEVTPGINYTTALERYNETLAKEDKIKLNYTEADLLAALLNVENGKTDFNLINDSMLQQYIREHNLNLKTIPLNQVDSEKIGRNYSYLMVSKTAQGATLIEKMDKVIVQLAQNGTLKAISEKYLGSDYIPYDQLGD